MPHQCTTCERTFPDGSKEMLSGCPDCGGNTFQFIPKGATTKSAEKPPERPDPPGGSVTRKAARAGTAVRDWVSGSDSEDSSSTETTSEGSKSTKEWPGERERTGSEPESGDLIDADAADSGGEDSAQSAARSDIVSEEELSWAASSIGDSTGDEEPTATGSEDDATVEDNGDGETREEEIGEERVGEEETDDDSDTGEDGEYSPGIDELRRELNEQFESIRIVDRGTYELNLMELYKRDEYIIALREDGRYVIEMPESFRGER